MEAHLHSLPRNTSLDQELHQLPFLPRCCSLNGILCVTPVEAVLVQFRVSNGVLGGSDLCGAATCWSLMLDGVLPAVCGLIEAPADLEAHFHCITSLTAALSLQYAAAKTQVRGLLWPSF